MLGNNRSGVGIGIGAGAHHGAGSSFGSGSGSGWGKGLSAPDGSSAYVTNDEGHWWDQGTQAWYAVGEDGEWHATEGIVQVQGTQ